jgi:O-glycosyl hydrolase
MINKFSNSQLEKDNGVKISMFESGEIAGQDSVCASYYDCLLGKDKKYVFKNAKLRKYFDTVSTHSYWSSTETKQDAENYLAEKYSSYGVDATEYCQMTNDENTGVYDLISQEKNGTNGLSIEYGVAMANVIMDDLTILNAQQWNWWLGCSYGVYTDGLVYINADNHEDVQTSKRLWCLGNFSKFIKEDAVRIACSSGVENVSSCAFVNTDNSTVVVYVNNTNNDTTTSLSVNNAYEVYTTSEQYDLEKTAEGLAGDATIQIPAMSVVTVRVK